MKTIFFYCVELVAENQETNFEIPRMLFKIKQKLIDVEDNLVLDWRDWNTDESNILFLSPAWLTSNVNIRWITSIVKTIYYIFFSTNLLLPLQTEGKEKGWNNKRVKHSFTVQNMVTKYTHSHFSNVSFSFTKVGGMCRTTWSQLSVFYCSLSKSIFRSLI